jgi:hypothetical protein
MRDVFTLEELDVTISAMNVLFYVSSPKEWVKSAGSVITTFQWHEDVPIRPFCSSFHHSFSSADPVPPTIRSHQAPFRRTICPLAVNHRLPFIGAVPVIYAKQKSHASFRTPSVVLKPP